MQTITTKNRDIMEYHKDLPNDYSKVTLTFFNDDLNKNDTKLYFTKGPRCYHKAKYVQDNIIKLKHNTNNGAVDMDKNLNTILKNGPGKKYMIKVTDPKKIKENDLSDFGEYEEYELAGVTCYFSTDTNPKVSGGKRRKTKRKNKNKKRKTRRYRY